MSAKILVVDDERDVEPLFRQNLRREIKSGLFELDFAFSGVEALEYLEGDKPPSILVVLSDVNMPGMSGVELLSKIKPDRPDLEVIMITAYGDVATRKAAEDGGARDFYTKPVDFSALRQQLKTLIAA